MDNIEYKVCSKCKVKKPLTKEFFRYRYTQNRFYSQCKECEKIYNKEYEKTAKRIEYKQKYEKSEHRKELNRLKEKTEKRQEYLKKYKESGKKKIVYQRYYDNNKDAIGNRVKQRKAIDKKYHLILKLRGTLISSFKRKGYKKDSNTYKIIGTDYDTFYNHLLETYKNNYGYEWDKKEEVHIDHIIPISTAKTEQDIYKLCHYTNLQLLKAKDNLEKGAKLDYIISDDS